MRLWLRCPELLSRFVSVVLLTASAFGADRVRGESGTPAESGPEICNVALLRNGFRVQYVRREVAGPATRLWLCADAGSGYAEIPSVQIEEFEESQNEIRLAPEAPVSASETTATGKLPVEDPIKKDPIKKMIASAASRYQIDPDFVASVVKAESGFDPMAVSPKGAQGLMQLMPDTAARLGVENVFDPAANLDGGTKYLRQLLDLFAGDAVKALAAYNAGPRRVEQYGGIPPYRETEAYVARVIDDYNRKKLQQAHPPAAPADK